MAGIPTSPLRRGITPFRRSLRVLGTQQSVPFRCLASPLAASNTAVGSLALRFNDASGAGNANGNTAVGTQALFTNSDGAFNDAVGASALVNNTDGFGNNAFGNSALFSNVTGAENTALGDAA